MAPPPPTTATAANPNEDNKNEEYDDEIMPMEASSRKSHKKRSVDETNDTSTQNDDDNQDGASNRRRDGDHDDNDDSKLVDDQQEQPPHKKIKPNHDTTTPAEVDDAAAPPRKEEKDATAAAKKQGKDDNDDSFSTAKKKDDDDDDKKARTKEEEEASGDMVNEEAVKVDNDVVDMEMEINDGDDDDDDDDDKVDKKKNAVNVDSNVEAKTDEMVLEDSTAPDGATDTAMNEKDDGNEDKDNNKNNIDDDDGDSKEDVNGTATSTSPNKDNAKNAYDSLRYIVVRNDGTPESMIKLVGLKSLFAKQLPKMPRAYIARLVFDRRHTSLAILSDNPDLKDSDEEIIGGICYRAFEDMRFAEIAFCAVNAKHQVKGYGTKLMNLLKKIGGQTGIEYYITYADNYAIGYFKKQGFTKSIQMPKGRYLGLIKDYDGGTPMECYVHPSIDFTRIPEMLDAQQQFLMDRISLNAQSRTNIYPPLQTPGSVASQQLPQDASSTLGRGSQAAARALAIPGMVQAGWTLNDLMAATGQGKEADRQKAALKSELLGMVRKIEEQQYSWPFREPVDTSVVPDYLDVIKEPIDLSTIDKRIRQENYYRSKEMLFADLMLMVNNCKLYNDEASSYVQCAVSLETFIGTLFRKEPGLASGR